MRIIRVVLETLMARVRAIRCRELVGIPDTSFDETSWVDWNGSWSKRECFARAFRYLFRDPIQMEVGRAALSEPR